MTDRYASDDNYRRGTPDTVFERQIAPLLSTMEETRLAACAASRWRWTIAIPPLLLAAAAASYLTYQNGWSWVWVIFGVAMFGVVLAVWARTPKSNFVKKQRDTVLKAVCDHLGDMTYSYGVTGPDFGIEDFSNAKIIPGYTSADLEDLIEGTHRGCRFALVEAELESGSGRNRSTVFEGLLLRISLPRRVSQPITIARDRSGWGSLGSSIFGWFIPGDPVTVPHAGFEAEYDVYSKDATAALAIITPEFVRNFLALPEVLKSDKILAAFVDDMFLVSVAGTPPFLDDFSASKPVTELRGAFEKIVDETQVIHRVIDQLLEGDRYAQR